MGTPTAAAVSSGDFRRDKLQQFVDWSAAHVIGDEKGQAQIFLDRLFQAFGQKGSLDVGGTAEMRIRKDKGSGGGTSFAGYVCKPVSLIRDEARRRLGRCRPISWMVSVTVRAAAFAAWPLVVSLRG